MMTRDRLLQRIALGKYQNFSEIGKKHLDSEVALAWLKTGLGSLREIPLHLVTDELRIEAMTGKSTTGAHGGLSPHSLSSIKPSHTERYEEIALLGIKTSERNIFVVDHDVLNNDFMKKALQVNGNALLPLLDEDANPEAMGMAITQELIELAVSRSASYFGHLKKDQYSQQAVRECIQNVKMVPKDFQSLTDAGHFDVLVEVIKTGWWGDHLPEKPSNLSDCAVKLLVSPEDKFVYRAYAMTYPIRDVIAFFAGPTLRQELLQMYSRAELAPHLKEGPLSEDRAFKGRLLESELGL
jgi:hypothetical protein